MSTLVIMTLAHVSGLWEHTRRFFLLTVRALVVWCWAGEERFGGGTPIGHVHVQPGEGDGVLDDGRDGRRRRGQILRSLSGSVVRASPDVPQRPGEERADLVVRRGDRVRLPVAPVGRAAVVAQEGGVPEDVAAPSHVHGVAEVSQRRADHVHGEVTFVTPPAVGVWDQTFEAWQLLLKIHDHRAWSEVVYNPKRSQNKFQFCRDPKFGPGKCFVIRLKVRSRFAGPNSSWITVSVMQKWNSAPCCVNGSFALLNKLKRQKLRRTRSSRIPGRSCWSVVSLSGLLQAWALRPIPAQLEGFCGCTMESPIEWKNRGRHLS